MLAAFGICHPRAGAAIPTVLAGPLTDGMVGEQSWYYLLSASSWTEAEAKAKAMGGHLATAGSPVENNWLWGVMRKAAPGVVPDGIWLGYSQPNPQAVPCGSDDGAFTPSASGFSNWGAGQPDNGAGLTVCEPENFVMMDAALNGAWNDAVDNPPGIAVHGIVEIQTFNFASTCNFNAYHGDANPSGDGEVFNAIGETWANLRLFEGTQMGSVIADPQARDGWAYRINDTDATPAGTEKWVVRGNPAGDLTVIVSGIQEPGNTVAARVKIPSWNDNGAGGSNLFVDDFRFDRLQTTHIRWDGQTPLLQETLRGLSATLPPDANDGQYHIIRWSIGMDPGGGGGGEDPNSRTVHVYFDENPVPVLTIGPGVAGIDGDCCNHSGYNSATVPYAGEIRDGWGFGTDAQGGTSDFYLDWFAFFISKERYNTATGGVPGAVPPGVDHAFNDFLAKIDGLNHTRCGLTVSPAFNFRASLAHCASQDGIFTLTNWSPATTDYTVEIGIPQPDGTLDMSPVPWISVDKTSGSVAPGATDQVVVTLTADAPAGVHYASLRFVSPCDFAPLLSRELRLTALDDGPPCTIQCFDPFADLDEDGDVDSVDFAAWQNCYTGPDDPKEALDPNDLVCGCADHDADDDIDADDLTAFVNCGSGPSVPADIACDDPQP